MQLTLPSLRGDKTKDIGKVHLETRYLWIDCERYHGYKVVNAVKANVAQPIVPESPNISELQRQNKARMDTLNKSQFLNGRIIPIDRDYLVRIFSRYNFKRNF